MIPSGNDKYDIRFTRITVAPCGEPVFSERATRIEIDDEAGGEFVKITQEGGHTDVEKSVVFDPEEWAVIREAIDYVVGLCRKETP